MDALTNEEKEWVEEGYESYRFFKRRRKKIGKKHHYSSCESHNDIDRYMGTWGEASLWCGLGCDTDQY